MFLEKSKGEDAFLDKTSDMRAKCGWLGSSEAADSRYLVANLISPRIEARFDRFSIRFGEGPSNETE